MKAPKAYRGVQRAFQLYWRSYGGLKAVLASPFFHLSLILVLICYPLWWAGNWWEKVFAIVPSLLGFSIASFTIFLSIGDERFRRLLGVVRPGKEYSSLVSSASAFFHFILLQSIALILALIASAQPMAAILEVVREANRYVPAVPLFLLIVCAKVFRAAGALFLIYALLSAVAAMLNVFRITHIFSGFATNKFLKENEKSEQESDKA